VSELSAGQVVGTFRVEGIIARGGMGVIYRAHDVSLDRPVALKVVAPELSESPAFRARFERESRLAASISHPNVLPVFSTGEVDGRPYLVVALVEGADLREVISLAGRLEPVRAAVIVAQVASALDAAHARGLVHRDVKPSNVLIASQHGAEHAFLTDFGLAKSVRTQTDISHSGQFLGTLDFAPPEQIRGLEIDGRADVYALGCVLHQALTGDPPFPGATDAAVLYAHLFTPPPAPSVRVSGIPPLLDEVVARAMAKDPAGRYPSAGDLGRATLAAVDGRRAAERERTVAVGEAGPRRAIAADATTRPDELRGAAQATTAGADVRGDRRSRGGVVAAVVGGALAAGAAVVAVLLVSSGGNAGGDGTTSTTSTGPPRIAGPPIAVGPQPTAIAAGGGGVWVADGADGTLRRIDPAAGRVTRQVRLGGSLAGVAVGAGAVWATRRDDGALVRIDPARGEVVGRPISVARIAGEVAVGEGGVWVVDSGDGLVTRVDPATSQVLGEPIRVGGDLAGIATGGGSVWVADREGRVLRIDPRTSAAAGRPIRVDLPVGVAVGEGAVWATSATRSVVYRIDPATNALGGAPLRAGGEPDAVAIGEGRVWVANSADASVTAIDPQTRAATTLRTGSRPESVAVGGGGVWVANRADGTVTRIRP
jgi:serine/threonine-protein kinase